VRADRLLNIMVLLQNNGKMTTEQLSRTLEVSQRTILRDMDALSLSGIPVIAERGKAGGWKLMDRFRSQISSLTLADMKTLFILPSEKILEELGLHNNGLDIRQKLLASMPGPAKRDAQQYLEKIYIDTGTWQQPSSEKSKALNIVQQALWENKKLSILYEKADGYRSQRLVHPLGLVSKGSAWYLVALNDNNEYRNFRMSRIVQAAIEAEEFIRPEHFHLAEYWKQSKLDFTEALPSFEVQVLAHREMIGRMTFTDKFVKRVDANSETGKPLVNVTLKFNTEQEAIEYVLGYGGRIRLVQPEYLIDKIVQQARMVIEMYE